MLTPLEKAVLDSMLDKPGAQFEMMRQQVAAAVISQSEFSGVGFFTEFVIPPEAMVINVINGSVSLLTLYLAGRMVQSSGASAGRSAEVKTTMITKSVKSENRPVYELKSPTEMWVIERSVCRLPIRKHSQPSRLYTH